MAKSVMIRCPFCGILLIEAAPASVEADGTVTVSMSLGTLTEILGTATGHIVEDHTDGLKEGTRVHPAAVMNLAGMLDIQSLIEKLEAFTRDAG